MSFDEVMMSDDPLYLHDSIVVLSERMQIRTLVNTPSERRGCRRRLQVLQA